MHKEPEYLEDWRFFKRHRATLWDSEEKITLLQGPPFEHHSQGQAGCGLGKI